MTKTVKRKKVCLSNLPPLSVESKKAQKRQNDRLMKIVFNCRYHFLFIGRVWSLFLTQT